MRKKAQKIPALLGKNGFAYSDSIKAETIALSLEKQFSLNDLSHRETEKETLAPLPILIRNFKILKSSSKRHATSLSEQLTVKYHIQRFEFSAEQQLLFTGTSSYSAPATTAQDPDGLPPTHPLPPTTTTAHLIPRTEIIQHH
ncbi:hypothetical protein AVEN_74462-1 [Araneus ventricosus]|uniref:Uncharacterized protein n=1 Tax=Araneus ventricosus TaxID=182803 RepID=A0A4Y2TV92_ARAVE|nr:hypothetical protein AVEN_74462-1 [Araneus ventricosus]